MKEEELKNLIGRTITNIFTLYGEEQGWLNTCDTLIELDGEVMLAFTHSQLWRVETSEVPREYESIFDGQPDTYSVYHVNKEGKYMRQIREERKTLRPRNWWRRLFLLKEIPEVQPYRAYLMEEFPVTSRRIQNDKISGILKMKGDDEQFIVMAHGGIFTHTYMSPKGTSSCGINYFDSMDALKERYSESFVSL